MSLYKALLLPVDAYTSTVAEPAREPYSTITADPTVADPSPEVKRLKAQLFAAQQKIKELEDGRDRTRSPVNRSGYTVDDVYSLGKEMEPQEGEREQEEPDEVDTHNLLHLNMFCS